VERKTFGDGIDQIREATPTFATDRAESKNLNPWDDSSNLSRVWFYLSRGIYTKRGEFKQGGRRKRKKERRG
jgi:hypothetical protein